MNKVKIVTDIEAINSILKSYLDNHIKSTVNFSFLEDLPLLLFPSEDLRITFSIARSPSEQNLPLEISCKNISEALSIYNTRGDLNYRTYPMAPCLALGVSNLPQTDLSLIENFREKILAAILQEDSLSEDLKNSLVIEEKLQGEDHLNEETYNRISIVSQIYDIYFLLIFFEKENLVIVKAADDMIESQNVGKLEIDRSSVNVILQTILNNLN